MTDLSPLLQPDRGQPARTIHVVHPDQWAGWLKGQPARVRTAITANKVVGKAGNRAVLPGDKDDDWSMLLVCDEAETSPYRIASQPANPALRCSAGCSPSIASTVTARTKTR